MPSCAYWPHCVRPASYYKGAFVTPEDQDLAIDIDAEDEADRSATQASLDKDRSATLIALVDAVRNFRRVWPDGMDETVANIMPSLDE